MGLQGLVQGHIYLFTGVERKGRARSTERNVSHLSLSLLTALYLKLVIGSYSFPIYRLKKKVVLGRSNHLLFFDRTRTA
jgi:hypothetical protein